MNTFDCCGCRNSSFNKLLNLAPNGDAKTDVWSQPIETQCGIGVVFRCATNGSLVVDSVVPGGPAWESSQNGGIQVDDVLHSIDGKDVFGWPVVQLAPMLLGPEGTTVKLGVRRDSTNERGSNVTHHSQLTVEITRKKFSPPAEPFDQMRSRPASGSQPIVDVRGGFN